MLSDDRMGAVFIPPSERTWSARSGRLGGPLPSWASAAAATAAARAPRPTGGREGAGTARRGLGEPVEDEVIQL
jgi:hypothetical protein